MDFDILIFGIKLFIYVLGIFFLLSFSYPDLI